jgi:hypothetical protein
MTVSLRQSKSLRADTSSSMLDDICSLLLCSRFEHSCLGMQAVAAPADCLGPASDHCVQGLGAGHMRALARLPQMKVLNLYDTIWQKDAIALGPEWLTARLPRLQVFNAPANVLVRLFHLPACF